MISDPNILVFAYNEVGYQCLKSLLERGDKIVAVYTHPDNPNEEIWFHSVKKLADEYQVPVFMPASVNTEQEITAIKALKPDLILSFYYRHMISQAILDLPRLGAYNMHGSLLPKYRGRCPINWAIIYGETETGATLHKMVKRADAGDIVDQQAVPIVFTDTAHDVFLKVTAAACDVLLRQIDNLKAGSAPSLKQDEALVSYFGGRKPEDGRIDWQKSAREIYDLVRAVTHPYPGAFAEFDGKKLLVWQAIPLKSADKRYKVGEIISDLPLQVQTGDGILQLAHYEWI